MQQLLENPIVLYLTLGVVSLLLAYRSQLDEWAESNPRVAGTLKLMRSVGIDPWMLLQGLSLILRGRLPKPPGEGNGAGSGPGTGGQGAVKGDHIVFPPLQSEPPPSNDRVALSRLQLAAVFGALLVVLPGCSTFRDVVKPAVVTCAPAPQEVVQDVWLVLSRDGGGKLTDRAWDALQQLIDTHGKTFVYCAAAELTKRLVGAENETHATVAAKAEEFLSREGVTVNESPAGAAACP